MSPLAIGGLVVAALVVAWALWVLLTLNLILGELRKGNKWMEAPKARYGLPSSIQWGETPPPGSLDDEVQTAVILDQLRRVRSFVPR